MQLKKEARFQLWIVGATFVPLLGFGIVRIPFYPIYLFCGLFTSLIGLFGALLPAIFALAVHATVCEITGGKMRRVWAWMDLAAIFTSTQISICSHYIFDSVENCSPLESLLVGFVLGVCYFIRTILLAITGDRFTLLCRIATFIIVVAATVIIAHLSSCPNHFLMCRSYRIAGLSFGLCAYNLL